MKKSQLVIISFLVLFFQFSTNNCLAQYYKLFDFSDSLGETPYGNLISDGNFLYGMTNSGSIFKIKGDGTNFSKLYELTDITPCFPRGSLILDSAFLYGMTPDCGINHQGNIFKIKSDGTEFATIYSFSGYPDGDAPVANNLYTDGSYLYGMTPEGGLLAKGTIFKINFDGTNYATLFDFDGISGSRPHGSLIFDGNFLYGLTSAGGTGGYGVIFKIKQDGTQYTKLFDFDSINGKTPMGDLDYDGTFLYGMTNEGGSLNQNAGAIFKIKPDGTEFSKLLDFDSNNGNSPYGSLIHIGSYLYGMSTFGGMNGSGEIFKIKSDGTDFVHLYDFNYDGENPFGSLLKDGVFVYGMTYIGGVNYDGVIFKNCIAQYITSYDSIQNSFILNIDSTVITSATSFDWDFGDGSTSTLATPFHTYTYDSVFNVCMKIYLALGDSCVYCHEIGKDSLGNIIRNGGFNLNVQSINSAVNVHEKNTTKMDILIYPNPTSGMIKIATQNYPLSDISVYNTLGECVYKNSALIENDGIDLTNQSNGIYFLKIKTKNVSLTKKIIIYK